MNDIVLMGRLAEAPVAREVKVEGKGAMKVVNTVIYLFDPFAEENEKGLKEGIRINISAWDVNAEILSSKVAGTIITFTGKIRVKKDNNNKQILYVTVAKIDPHDSIAKELSALIKDYNSSSIDKLYEIEEF